MILDCINFKNRMNNYNNCFGFISSWIKFKFYKLQNHPMALVAVGALMVSLLLLLCLRRMFATSKAKLFWSSKNIVLALFVYFVMSAVRFNEYVYISSMLLLSVQVVVEHLILFFCLWILSLKRSFTDKFVFLFWSIRIHYMTAN